MEFPWGRLVMIDDNPSVFFERNEISTHIDGSEAPSHRLEPARAYPLTKTEGLAEIDLTPYRSQRMVPREGPWYNSPYAINLWTKGPISPWYPVGTVGRLLAPNRRRFLLEEQQIDRNSFKYRVIVPQLGMVLQLFPQKVRGVRRLYTGDKVKIRGLRGEYLVFRDKF